MRPNVKDRDAAIRAFYGNGYISNAEIKKIFDIKSDATVARLKRAVKEKEKERGIPTVVPHCIDTKVAFEVWGINIAEFVKNREKLQRLGL